MQRWSLPRRAGVGSTRLGEAGRQVGVDVVFEDPVRLADPGGAQLPRLDQPVDGHGRDPQEVGDLLRGEEPGARHSHVEDPFQLRWGNCMRPLLVGRVGTDQEPRPSSRLRSVASITASRKALRTPPRSSARSPAAVVPPGEVTAARNASRSAMVTPAAIDNTGAGAPTPPAPAPTPPADPTPASARQATSTSPGLTATTCPSAAAGSPAPCRSGKRPPSPAARPANRSTTRSSASDANPPA